MPIVTGAYLCRLKSDFLSINGRVVKDLWGAPFEADCTVFLRRGENQIEAVLFSTLANTLGHYHHQHPWLDPAYVYEEYFLAPLGLAGVPELRVT